MLNHHEFPFILILLYIGTIPEIGDREAEAKFLLDMQLIRTLVQLSQLPGGNRRHSNL